MTTNLATKTPRPYQLDAEAAVARAFERHDSTLVVLPTGMGKTIVMARIAAGWERGNVLLVAHRVELLDQAAEKIGCELGYLPPIEQGSRGVDPHCLWTGGQVIVGSVQTLQGSRLDKFAKNPFGLLLIDEGHHATAATYGSLIRHLRTVNPQLKVLLVTATPKRADGTAIGIVADSVAYEMHVWDAISDGWLVPIEQQYVCVDEVDFSHLTLGKNELGESDVKASELEALLVEEEALHALAVPIIERAERRQGLVFTSGVAHAHLLAAVLNRHRDGCAKAIDGKTDKEERKKAVEAFHAGELQFLTNFGVLTEGFDAPAVGIVAMGRPTKSVGLYQQMLGRGTRPLPGVVDGHPSADARRAAIKVSPKPTAIILDFVGNSRHKLVSAVDALGGNYDPEVRELARKRVAAKGGGDVQSELRKARAELALAREQQRRAGIKAQVAYSSQDVDPFQRGEADPGAVAVRGGASDAQIGLLVNLGVPREVAAGYSPQQAGVVITSLRAKRCTIKQQAILRKYGEPIDVPCDEASRIIDEIASNGWRPRRKEAAHA